MQIRSSTGKEGVGKGRLLVLAAALMTGLSFSDATAQNNRSESPVQIVNGELEYIPYTNRCTGSRCRSNPEPNTNRLRGYSYAGYRGGGVPLPNASVDIRIQAGNGRNQLRANSERDADHNADIIQNALNTVDGRADRPRAVQLPAGRFFIRPDLTINRDGVVLRGAGQGADGTVLIGTLPEINRNGAIIKVGDPNTGFNTIPTSRVSTSASLSRGGTVSNISDGDWIKLDNVRSTNNYRLRMNYNNRGSRLVDFTVRRDSPTGPIVGYMRNFPAEPTGTGTIDAILDAELSGTHDLYIVFDIESGDNFSVNAFAAQAPFREIGPRQRILQPNVVTGESKIRVQNPRSFSVGDRVMVTKTVNQAWIDYVDVNRTFDLPEDRLWRETAYDMNHERIISRIDGDEIVLDAPMLDTFYEDFGGGYVAKIDDIDRVSSVGIEDIRIENNIRPSGSTNHSEEQTTNGVVFTFAENSWIDGLTCRTIVFQCVGLEDFTRHMTVQNSAAIDWSSRITGGRRYGFHAQTNVSGVLFQRLFVDGGRHDYATGRQATGSVVFLDALSTTTHSDIGPHHRYATGILFDNIRGGEMSVQQRGGFGTGHGYSGAQVTYWNSDSLLDHTTSGRRSRIDLHVESAPGSRSFAIGGRADRHRIFNGGSAFGVNTGGASLVTPRSLYLAELEERLGSRAVEAVTIPAQRRGQIYDLLDSWRGEGPLVAGAESNAVTPVDDTYIRFGPHVDTNYGESRGQANQELRVKNSPSRRDDFDRWAFIEFDVSGIDRNSASRVTLELNVEDINRLSPGVTPITVRAHDSRNFRENQVTANNRPSRVNRTNVGDLNVSRTGRITLDVSDILSSNRSDLIYFELRDDTETNNLITFSSSESSNPPRLVFE